MRCPRPRSRAASPSPAGGLDPNESADLVSCSEWAIRDSAAERPGPNGARRLGSPPCHTIASMAYDENLANRIRQLVGSESDLTEKKMFGGLAFLIGGNLAVAASGQDGILVRDRPCAVRRARRDDQSPPHGNARAASAGVATSRPRRCSQQTPARQMGGSRHDVRPLAACEAIDLKSPSQLRHLLAPPPGV
jgi:hypothetical protein